MPKFSWDIFMKLLRAGLWEKDLQLDGPLNSSEWEKLLQAGRNQAVAGLFLRGVAHLPVEQMPPVAVRMQLLAEADEIERRNLQASIVEREVLERFGQEGIVPLVLKGSRAAKYYYEPLLRESGDIDLFIPKDEFESACAVFPGAKLSPDGSAVFTYKGVVVELHNRYYDLHVSPDKLPAVPSVCGELLLYSAHILKHALGPGIGFKQLCDMALALAGNEGKYSKADLEGALRRSGLYRWHRLLCSMLVSDLGLDPRFCLDSFVPCNPSPLRNIIRDGGNFGSTYGSRQKAIKSKNSVLKKTNTLLSFLRHIPFAITIAPGEAVATVRELIKGNIYN